MHIILYFCFYQLLIIFHEHHSMLCLEIYRHLIIEYCLILWICYNLFNQFPILESLDYIQFFIL